MEKELKSLKDIGNPRDNILNPIKNVIKQEAIKWWIFKHGRGEDVCCTCEEIWKEFFNITEEDLK